MDAGLCYKPCAAGYKGVGPVCWEVSPPSNPAYNYKCSDIAYTTSAVNCKNLLGIGIAGGAFATVGAIATCASSFGFACATVASVDAGLITNLALNMESQCI